jgi:hypothetical protein
MEKKQMTRQEIFDKALVAVLKQGEPAMTKSGGCDYWPGTGKMCAVGLLLGEDVAKEWTDAGVGDVGEVTRYKVTIPDWVVPELDLLMSIQVAHDMFVQTSPEDSLPSIDLEYWRSEFIRKMRLVAKKFDLEYKEELEHN